MLLLGQQLRTRPDLVRPSFSESIQQQQDIQSSANNGIHSSLEIGDSVQIRDVLNRWHY